MEDEMLRNIYEKRNVCGTYGAIAAQM